MDEIALDFAIDLSIEIQPTHAFDFNSQDALYHWAVKHGLRKQGFPKVILISKTNFRQLWTTFLWIQFNAGFCDPIHVGNMEMKTKVWFLQVYLDGMMLNVIVL